MFALKPLSSDGVSAALEKAERYRLLNEPLEAESICKDILEIAPENQGALITLLLALTDQFGAGKNDALKQSRNLVPRLATEYEQQYYFGIICERMGKAALHSELPGCHYDAYEWLRDAMEYFEKAEKLRPAGNDDAILRWNTCVRIIKRDHLEERPKDDFQPYLE